MENRKSSNEFFRLLRRVIYALTYLSFVIATESLSALTERTNFLLIKNNFPAFLWSSLERFTDGAEELMIERRVSMNESSLLSLKVIVRRKDLGENYFSLTSKVDFIVGWLMSRAVSEANNSSRKNVRTVKCRYVLSETEEIALSYQTKLCCPLAIWTRENLKLIVDIDRSNNGIEEWSREVNCLTG